MEMKMEGDWRWISSPWNINDRWGGQEKSNVDPFSTTWGRLGWFTSM
jgi:hypothetical protein